MEPISTNSGQDNRATPETMPARVPVFEPIECISPTPYDNPALTRIYILKPSEIIVYMNYDMACSGPLIQRMRPGRYTIATPDMLAYEVLKNLIDYPDDIDDYIVKFNDVLLDDLYKPIVDYIGDAKEAILIARPRPKFQVSARLLGSPTIYTMEVHEYTFLSDIRYEMLGDSLFYKFDMVYKDVTLDLEKMLFEYDIKSSVTLTFVPIMKSGLHAFKRAQQPILNTMDNVTGPPPSKVQENNNINIGKVCINQMPGFATAPHVYISQEEINKYLPNPKLIKRKIMTAMLEKHGYAAVFVFETGSVYLLTKEQRDYFKSSMPVLFHPYEKLTTSSKNTLIAIIYALMDRFNINTADTVYTGICNTNTTAAPATKLQDVLQKLKQSKNDRQARLERANTKLTESKQ